MNADLYCLACPIADDSRRVEDVALYAATVACDEADHALNRVLAARQAHGLATAGRWLRDMTAEDHAEGRRLDAEVLAANEAQRAANARYETARKALAAVIWHSSRSSAPSRWARRRDLRIQRRLAGGES